MSTELASINIIPRGEQSGGEISVMSNLAHAGFPEAPLHHAFDETFYRIEGELTFWLEDELFTRRRRELASATRGVPHTFANLSGAATYHLRTGWLRALLRPARGRTGECQAAPEASKPIPEMIVIGPRIGERYPKAQQSNRKERSS